MNLKYFDIEREDENVIIAESKHTKVIITSYFYNRYGVRIVDKRKSNSRSYMYGGKNKPKNELPNRYKELVESAVTIFKLSQ